MKKGKILILSMVLLIIIVICYVGIKVNSKINSIALKENKEYEQYLEDEIYGTDVVTLINKAISDNEKNKVTKDEKGNYLNNNKDSIDIDIIMITDEEKEKTKTYSMESISKVGITRFIKNFNTEKFKCTKKEYHLETGKISYIELTEQSSF